MRKTILSKDVKNKALEGLQKHVKEKYIGKYGVIDVIAKFKRRYLYIEWVEGDTRYKRKVRKEIKKFLPKSIRSEVGNFIDLTQSQVRTSKLCRLKYTGDINYWNFEIYKYSDEWYDVDSDFPFAGGTVEECFDAAASLYITHTFP